MALFTERQKINLISFVLTVGILCVAVELSSGSFATRINKISENLDRALSEVMSDSTIHFTNLTDNGTYVSDTEFNPKGMAGLYNFTNAFMEAVFSKNIYPEGFVTIDGNNNLQLGDYQQEWKSLLAKYGGLLAMIIILGLIIVLMPLCGLCFCCCRCCGKCGARSQPFDKKHDLCKKIVLATLLISLGTLLLFGVVCAFVSNQQMQEGVEDLTDNLRKGVKDVNTYLDGTKGQIETLLKTNYGEFEEVLLDTINESSNIVYNKLEDYANATAMTQVSNIVNAVPKIKEGFVTLKYSTNSLRVYASQLNDVVRKVKRDMIEILHDDVCSNIPKCKNVSNDFTTLQTNIHFNNLPDITEQMKELDAITQGDALLDVAVKGKEQLEKIRTEIAKAVDGTLGEAETHIKQAGKAIQDSAQNITSIVVDLQNQIESNTKPALDTADRYIIQYSPYRYYVALVISCLLLLIAVCIALGLICGICGKRPEGYGDDCCNKGAGSSFLICGVYFMFLTGFIIAVVVVVSFLLGILTQRAICDPLREPTNSQVFDLLDKVNLSQFHVPVPLSETLENCYQNKSIYVVLDLKKQFDLDRIKNYLDEFQINQILESLNLTSLQFLKNFTILDDSDKATLENFANSDFANINFDEFKELLTTSFTNVNFTDLSDELGELIKAIPDTGPEAQDLIRRLQVNKMNIDMYQEKIVEPMIRNASAVVSLAKELEDNLKLNYDSFKEAMGELMKELQEAEKKIQEGGYDFVTNTVTLFTTGIVNQVQTYIDRVVEKTQTEVGQCGPLSLVINATLTSTCDRILLPWNGFWFGLFWSVLIFIPTIIVSVKLATLYQKHSAYSRDLVEAEYLYDAYVDRDNIPLNSRGGKSKKKNKKHKRYEDRPVVSAGGDMVAREYAAGSNHQDARYADMAPKQWEDFPAGGPPQYQRAPTEYERPPPYYYPGAGENTQ